MLNFIKNLFSKQVEDINYPADFAIIDFTSAAINLGIKDDRNKIISRNTVNEYGNYATKNYEYSEQQIKVLQEIHKIPIYDKTKGDIRFPVYSTIIPGEATFTQSR